MDHRSVRATFTDPEQGYIAVYRMRGAGFRVEVSGSIAGDVVVTVPVPTDRLVEMTAIVEDCEGRLTAAEA
jgi:hypothetical protein